MFCFVISRLGESCSHVGALLYKVEAAVRLGFTQVACTDVPCLWNQYFVKKVQPERVTGIKFYKSQHGKNDKPRRATYSPATEADQQTFLSSLSNTGIKAVGLSSFENFASMFYSTKPSEQIQSMPHSLRSFYRASNCELDADALQTLCIDSERMMTLSDQQCKYVEEVTRDQSGSASWHDLRIGRITASVANDVLHTDPVNMAQSLLTKICQRGKVVHSPSLQWGVQHEPDAFMLHSAVCGISVSASYQMPSGYVIATNPEPHTNCSSRKAGLVISSVKPHVAASPDDFIWCDCCGLCVIEIKCPYSMRDGNLMEGFRDGQFCLTPEYKFKTTHRYFAQVQMQMYVCGLAYCDFVLWSPGDCVITRVPRDDDSIESMIPKLDMLWKRFVLPELLTRNTENKSAPRLQQNCSDITCACCGLGHSKLVFCSVCKLGYHAACLGLKGIPKSKKWSCPACKEVK